MINGYWIVNLFGIKFDLQIMIIFRIFIVQGMVNDCWIVWVFGRVSVFGM